MNETSSPQPASPPLPPVPSGPADEPRDYEALDKPVSIWSVSEGMLKTPGRLVYEMREGRSRQVMISLALLALVCFVAYGATVGTFSMGRQLWVAPLKLGLGIFLSAVICFPSLFIFSCLSGVECRLKETAGILLGLLALTGLLLVGFAPVSWIFSQSTNSMVFMGVLHLIIWAVSLGYGLRFLGRSFTLLSRQRGRHLVVWGIIFTLVTLQMTATLRPLLGTAETILPQEKSFFLNHWFNTLDGEISE